MGSESRSRVKAVRRVGRSSVAALALFVVHTFPSGARAERDPHTVRLVEERLPYDGRNREYLLHVPRSYVEGTRVPLVLLLHGDNSSAREISRVARFQPLSARDGFILAFPEAVGHRWNDAEKSGRGRADRPDDVGFLASLVAALSAKYSIDERRIYIVGTSNGATMAFRAVCELPGLFAAIGSVNGSMPRAIAEGCSTLRPLSIAMVNGTADAVVPFDGRSPPGRRDEIGPVITVEKSARFWARLNGCHDTPSISRVRDVDIATGYRVRRAIYGDCNSGRQVQLFIVDGGGHRWPEPSATALTRHVGRRFGVKTDEVFGKDISGLLWEFLARQEQ